MFFSPPPEPRQSFATYLKPSAFTPYTQPDIKGSPYPAEIKIISTYPKKDDKSPAAEAERKAFQDQFYLLLEAFKRWGEDHQCYDAKGVTYGMDTIRAQFFDLAYSGNQSPLYFESIKQNLEKILLTLRDEAIPLEKRTKTYTSLCPNFVVCGPGLFTHIEAAQNEMSSNESPEKWLAELRTSIIRRYADAHAAKKRIPESNSIHVFNGYANYACDQKWNPIHTMIDDPFIIHVSIEPKDLEDFHRFFESEYNPTAIRECIQVNINLMFRKIFEEFGFKKDAFNNPLSPDYLKFTEKLEAECKKLGIPFSATDFFEYEKKDEEGDPDYASNFRLNAAKVDNVVSTLCEQVLKTTDLYFDPVSKKYWRKEEFFIAVAQGRVEVARALLEAKADPTQAVTNRNSMFYGASPLFIAAQQGYLAIVTALLEAKADPKQARTDDDTSPLYIAAQERQEAIVTALLEAKADPNKTTTDGATPLYIATFYGYPAIVTALLEAKADPTQAVTNRNSKFYGASPLFIAAQKGHEAIVTALLAAKAGS